LAQALTTDHNLMFKVFQLITVALLFWAVAPNPYDYYTLLRFIVCPVSAYAAYKSYKVGNGPWVWALGVSAVLFNPILKVHLQRETWSVLNVIFGLITLASIFALKAKTGSASTANDESI
jgi:hypothetical protein